MFVGASVHCLMPTIGLANSKYRSHRGVSAYLKTSQIIFLREGLEPVVARYRDLDIRKYFRGDAAFAIPELYVFLQAEHYG